jgi:hypothetical protein
MSQLKRSVVGHGRKSGGNTALKSAAVLAHRCQAANCLAHVVEPQHSYQRISHPLASPCAIEDISQKAGAKLQKLTVNPELSGLQVEHEVRTASHPVLTVGPEAFQFEIP